MIEGNTIGEAMYLSVFQGLFSRFFPSYTRIREVIEGNTIGEAMYLSVFQGLFSRFFPSYTRIKEVIEGNTIGEAMYLSTHFGSDVWHVPRIKDNKLGGGVLMDLGIYGVSLALWVFREEPIRISASAIIKNGMLYKIK